MNDVSQGLLITDPKSNIKYSLIRKLGEGGFGEVWLANEQGDKHHQIAIKFFNPLQESDKKQFLYEYQQTAKFHHKDVLPSLFYGEWNNRLFIGMEYCELGTAAQFIGLSPRDEHNVLWNLIYDTASGLEYLHEKENIVHQDIKPDNIMIKSFGDFVIMDFGISINVNSQLQSANYSEFGSPAYMAPERFTSNSNIIFANDIWSFGVTIYEIVTGSLPFNGMGGIAAIGNAPTLPQGWSSELNKVMQACLAFEPWSRKRARDIKEYAYWILRGKIGPDPWADFIPQTTYPNQINIPNQNRNNQIGGRSTARNARGGNSTRNNNGRATSRNNNSGSGALHNRNGNNGGISNGGNGNMNNNTLSTVSSKKNHKVIFGIIFIFLSSTLFVFFLIYKDTVKDYETRIESIFSQLEKANSAIGHIRNVFLVESDFDDSFSDWTSNNHRNNSIDSVEYIFQGYQDDKLMFDYQVDSEKSYDHFICYLKSVSTKVKIADITGRNQRGKKEYIIPSNGEYTVLFMYKKDLSYSKGNDQVLVSNIKVKHSKIGEIMKIVDGYYATGLNGDNNTVVVKEAELVEADSIAVVLNIKGE